MKCVIAAVISKDGFITRGDDADVRAWTSPEEKAHFADLRSQHQLFVFGSKTFAAIHPKPIEGVLKVVLTSHPERYKELAVDGQLEFQNLSSQEFVKKYSRQFDSCLILGGSTVYTDFLYSGLVDEVILTIEPVTHGQGVPFLLNNKQLRDYGFSINQELTLNRIGTKIRVFNQLSS